MTKPLNKPAAEPVQVIESDAADRAIFNCLKRESAAVGELCKDDASQGLTQDAFSSFFTHEPKVLEQAPIVQKGLIQQMMQLPEFADLRSGTVFDDVASGLATLAMAPNLIKQFEEVTKKMEEARQKAQEQGQPGPQGIEGALSDQDLTRMRHALRQGMKEAQDKADEWKDACAGWGVDPGELAAKPIGEKMELAGKLMKAGQLKKITDLAGRFRHVVNAHSAITPVGGYDEIVDIGLSSDVARMLPSEMFKMTELEDLWAIDFVENKLMTYELRGVEPQGKGPIIVCLDISGSMAGDREIWSKAVILSLMALAEKQKRSFGIICFEARVRQNAYWDKAEPPTLEQKLQIAGIAADGGGTDFYPALIGAFQMREAEPGLKPADIVFITDGDSRMSEAQVQEVLERKEKTGVRIFSIAIQDGGYAEAGVQTLEKFSDEIASVNSMGEIDHIKGLVARTSAGKGQKKGKKVA